MKFSTADRLQRLISIVSWVAEQDGPTIDEVCARFAIGCEELVAQLDRASMVGAESGEYGDMPIEVFDWSAWLQTDEARGFLADHQRIADATPDQLIKLCTSLKRGDRFSEGTLAYAFESGLLLAIVRRAEVLGG